ncbi:MAG: NAD(P)-dependent oxidoreductase [Parasporobacterium sp.]|nr:NAD(P)-dependent oxidoreductase [Parasporobacterium sp.]
MALYIENEAKRCLQCENPMCQEYCPVSTPIPRIVSLFKENRVLDAGKLLFANNPLSAVCSMVCNHESQCAGHCILISEGAPVQFYNIEHFISDAYLDRIQIEKKPFNGRHVAVIGSGPAGLTAAVQLARSGFGVTIFERKDRIGGMLRYGIPAFRLPKSVLDRYERLLKRLGVQIRLNTTIGGALKIDTLLNDGYDAIFIGSGVWRPKTLGIHGESLANVHFGISYLENPDNHDLGETVSVIGMGNVAMEVARTAFRHGAQRVMMFSRDNNATASSQEMSFARLDGAEFIYGMQVSRITPEGAMFRRSILDEGGKIIGAEEKEILFPSDSVVIAISQGPKDKLILSTAHLEGTAKGLLMVDENNMTTREGVFAAGDVVTGPLTVVHAVAEAKRTAEAIEKYLLG